MKYFFTFFLFFLITSPVLATSPKTLKALENCADDMGENNKRDYMKSFKEKIVENKKNIINLQYLKILVALGLNISIFIHQ